MIARLTLPTLKQKMSVTDTPFPLKTVANQSINWNVQNDLTIAASQRDTEAFKFILKREGGYPFMNSKNGEGSPFHIAAMVGCTTLVKYILENCSSNSKLDVNLREPSCNKTALHFSATNGYVETVEFLLSAGAESHPLSFDVWTPMHYAAENGHAEVIVVLLNYGANPDIKNETSQTPAHLAAVYDHPFCFQTLVEHYGNRASRVMRETARIVRSTVPGLIPDMCRKIAAYAVPPSDLDIRDDWNKSAVDWAIETMDSSLGWDSKIAETLLIADEQDGWFF